MIYKLVKGVPAKELRAIGLGAHFARAEPGCLPGLKGKSTKLLTLPHKLLLPFLDNLYGISSKVMLQ
ncbi:hypothetical protein L7E55_17375 [Pelotomaculum isophthalicicum JI]|uniref:Uncharacterized protein n=1 Tax=Pelotomaculum isophthalicicum JI TaxID=947010 RepID=A0A9X4JWV6_9FIRM|nr:hypothetical protein [Pelotomaculum isophthalicicum]MDF9410083.1 hypothetical protein [Pelotomaculum isophthalicicum JI]